MSQIVSIFVGLAVLTVVFLPKAMAAIVGPLLLLYPCARYLPRKISWLPGLILFFIALLAGEGFSLQFFIKYAGVLDTVVRINISICLVLIFICFRYVPRPIVWLPCLLLLIAIGGTLVGKRMNPPPAKTPPMIAMPHEETINHEKPAEPDDSWVQRELDKLPQK